MDTRFDLFLRSRVALGLSKASVDWYRYMCKRYARWLEYAGHTIDSVKRLDLDGYQAWLRERYSPSTVHQCTTAVITFYRWLVEVELIDHDPTVKLKRPKVPDHIPPSVAREYVLHLLDSIQPTGWMDWRDKLAIRILFSTGMRIGELVALTLADLDLDRNFFIVTGKGGKRRYCPFGEDLCQPLYQWVHVQRPLTHHPYLLLSTKNGGAVRGGMTVNGLYDVLRRRCEAAAMVWKSPHAYRHGFALYMIEHGASTRLVQTILGHARLETTERYLQMSPQLVQGMFADIWPGLD